MDGGGRCQHAPFPKPRKWEFHLNFVRIEGFTPGEAFLWVAVPPPHWGARGSAGGEIGLLSFGIRQPQGNRTALPGLPPGVGLGIIGWRDTLAFRRTDGGDVFRSFVRNFFSIRPHAISPSGKVPRESVATDVTW